MAVVAEVAAVVGMAAVAEIPVAKVVARGPQAACRWLDLAAFLAACKR